MKQDQKKLVRAFELLLEGLGIDAHAPHFRGTPERAAKAWARELCSGLAFAAPGITTFPSSVDQMITLHEIPVRSMCAHHLLPFTGEATIAYIPGNGEIIGLSKLSRLTNHFARRPQVQEELTDQIADALAKLVVVGVGRRNLDTGTRVKKSKGGVAVLIHARHACMELRGVNHSGEMTTTALRGAFREQDAARDEFMKVALHRRNS